MTDLLAPLATDHVLEVGTGLGYQTAVLAQLAGRVFLVAAAAEVVPPALVEQLRPGGRMVLPLGEEEGLALPVVNKDAAGPVKRRKVLPVRFSRLETMA